MGKQRQKKNLSRFLGTYTLANGEFAVGELSLEGQGTLLKLHSDRALEAVKQSTCIEGAAYSGELLTLIDCTSPGPSTRSSGASTRYCADVFPSYVAVGRCHLKPSQPCVGAIHFTTTDLRTLFYDFDAFGCVIESKPIIDAVLQERRQMRSVDAGEGPIVAYFTGQRCIIEVSTAIGKVTVHHCPRHSTGGPSGVSIKNRIVVSIEPVDPVPFNDAVNKMWEVYGFLSMAAGRTQGIKHVRIATTEALDGAPRLLDIHLSLRWKGRNKSEQDKPHPGDVPLDPIHHPAEFATVFSDWIGRQNGWQTARSRYWDCLRRGNQYGSDRIVAAANMFDVLPPNAVPLGAELPDDLAATRDACSAMFRKHPAGIDRDSALSALGRLGKPSLPKKVSHRVAIVESKLGETFPELQFVASVAVKCRNFLVHGSSGVDYQAVEHLVPFLTDTLEFVFAASDLIEAGWDAQRWNAAPHGWGHSFARFRAGYNRALADLRRAITA